jgi:hypothetical protein
MKEKSKDLSYAQVGKNLFRFISELAANALTARSTGIITVFA